MAVNIKPEFMEFLKTVRKEAKIPSRELGKAIGKSGTYITYLESGKIKSIDFDTALNMLEYIHARKPIFAGSSECDKSAKTLLTEILSTQFELEPEEFIKQRIEWAKKEEERLQYALQEMEGKISILLSMLKINDVDLLETFLDMAKVKGELGLEEKGAINDFVSLLVDNNKKRLLLMMLDTLCPPDYGVKYVWHRTNHEHEFAQEFKQLLVKYGFQKEGE